MNKVLKEDETIQLHDLSVSAVMLFTWSVFVLVITGNLITDAIDAFICIAAIWVLII